MRHILLKNVLFQFLHSAYIGRCSKLYSAFLAPMWLYTLPPPHLRVATSQSAQNQRHVFYAPENISYCHCVE
jgi:hypothetical protein